MRTVPRLRLKKRKVKKRRWRSFSPLYQSSPSLFLARSDSCKSPSPTAARPGHLEDPGLFYFLKYGRDGPTDHLPNLKPPVPEKKYLGLFSGYFSRKSWSIRVKKFSAPASIYRLEKITDYTSLLKQSYLPKIKQVSIVQTSAKPSPA